VKQGGQGEILAKFVPIAALNCDVEPGKLAVLQRNFLHASTLIFGGWISTSTLEEKVLMNNPNERNPNQQQQNNPRPGQGGQQQGGGQKPGQQQQGGGQQKPGQQSQQPGQGGHQSDRDR
jgi:hypothetical protein